MALITQQNLERLLQIDVIAEPDPVVAEYIAHAQAVAEDWCKQPLEHASVTEIFEVDQWEQWYVTDRFPITAVTSITEDDTVLTVDDQYKVYEDGRLRRLNGNLDASWSMFPDAVTVVYTAGYGSGAPSPFDTVPDGLVRGITQICADMWQYAAQYAAQGAVPVSSVQLEGSDTMQFEVAEHPIQPGELSPAVKTLLSPYVKRKL
jgi:hypothetical protein